MINTKAAFRQKFKAYRQVMDATEYLEKSQEIVRKLLALPEFQEATLLHTYYPMPERREIQLLPLLEAWCAAGKRLALPIVLDFQAGVMQHVYYQLGDPIQQSAWGGWEPVSRNEVPLKQIDLVLAPCLGADRRGYRMGYGKGHYDRFLTHIKAPVVAAVYAENLMEEIPIEPHDQPVHILISEKETLRFL